MDNRTQHIFSGAERRVTDKETGEVRCLGCMGTYSKEYEICPECGYVEGTEVENALHIYPGTVLNEKYIVGKVLGYGGFGVTYLAWDTVLEIKVAIKEYLPSEFSTRSAGQTRITVFTGDKSKQFSDGKEKFIDEAKRLAVFRNEAGIVKIYDTFEENETAYIVMEYLEGETLAQRLEREGKIPADEAVGMLMPVIESLSKIHEEGIIHRDIAPDNIFLTNKGEVKLIDFGASRYATTSRSRSLTVIIKPGYSAEEQYRSRGDQGAHTDVYSLGAVLYKMITGVTPPDAMERRAQYEKNKKDMLVPISKITKEISKNQEIAIHNAMNVRIEDRTGEMITFAGELLSEEEVKRRRSGIKKIDPLTWPLWAKIGLPAGTIVIAILTVLLAAGVIGPKMAGNEGIPEGYALVPYVIGKTEEKAAKEIEKKDFNIALGERIESEYTKGVVVLQNPDEGNVEANGAIVTLTVSEGLGTAYVEDVTGKPIEEAKVILENLGFKVETEEAESAEVAPGSVISQSVAGGEELEKGETITLVVSIGSEDIDTSEIVEVPNVMGKSYEEAIEELKKKNLYYTKEEVYNESLPENEIIGMNPSAGEEVNAGTIVKITVNMGAKTTKLGDYSRKSVETVKAELEAQGISVSVKYEEHKEIAAGLIIKQTPEAGKEVKTGSTVTLVVSSGYTVTVPDVRGMKLDKAQETLRESGLASSVTYETSETVDKGKVITQSISANTEVEKGTLVRLVISSGAEEKESETEKVEVTLLNIAVTSKPTKTTYYVGDSFSKSGLKVTASYSDGTTKDVTSGVTVSTPDTSTSGTKTVTVFYEGKTSSFTITVQSIRVSLNKTSTTIIEGETEKITATTEPSGCSVSWSSSDTSVATVSDGKVTAKKAGNATITATITRGSETKQATCSVSVSSKTIAPTSVTISESTTSIGSGAFRNCTRLTDIYYSGTEEQWKEVLIASDNHPLLNAKIHYNSVGRMESIVSECEVGDIIEFGSYPQSEVKDEGLLTELNLLDLDWVSYEYYSGTGVEDDGLMYSSDYMKYADVLLNNENLLNIFVYADKESKIKRCLERAKEGENLSEKDIASVLLKMNFFICAYTKLLEICL